MSWKCHSATGGLLDYEEIIMILYAAGMDDYPVYMMAKFNLRSPHSHFMASYVRVSRDNPKLVGSRLRIIHDWYDKYVDDLSKTMILDSGAFTLLRQSRHSVKDSLRMHKTTGQAFNKIKNFEFYLEQYLEYVVTHKQLFTYFVEPDIGEAIGLGKIKQWRKSVAGIGLSNDRLIPVWHFGYMTWKDWEEMCREYPFVGVPGYNKTNADIYLTIIPRMVYWAYNQYGTRVHSFACLKPKLLSQIPFYSTDSSSWKAGERFGATLVMQFRPHRDAYPKIVAYKEGSIREAGQAILASGSSNKLNQLWTKQGLADVHFKALAAQQGLQAYADYEIAITRLWDVRGIRW